MLKLEKKILLMSTLLKNKGKKLALDILKKLRKGMEKAGFEPARFYNH
jgi:hypothetical protein